MINHTIISISPSNHYFGFVVMDWWEVKDIQPLALKGLSKEQKLEKLKSNIHQLIERHRPELALIEKLEGKRDTPANRYLLAQTVGIITAYGLPVRFLTNKEAKKTLCNKKNNPGWQEVVGEILEMPCLSSLLVKNFLSKFIGRTATGELKRDFRVYPLTDSKRYYWNALSALIIGLAYFSLDNNISYDYDHNNPSQETSAETDGSGNGQSPTGTNCS